MKCPKCGAEIKLFNLKPNCYNCGVNIMYYTQESGLIEDAKRSELEFASARIFGAKLLAAFVSGPLQIIRIVTTLLCVATLIIPYAVFNLSMPLFNAKFSIGGIGIYNMFSDGSLMIIKNLIKSTLYSDVTKSIVICLAILIIAALLSIAVLVLTIISFIDLKLFSKGLAIVSFCAAGFNVASFLVILAFKLTAPDVSYISVSLGFGAIATAIIFSVNGVINYLLSKKEFKLKIKENDLERKEILKAVKNGEMSLDELSLPVFETEEEKEERLKALKEALEKEEEGKE